MDLKAQTLIMNAATQYADQGVQYLSEALGRPANQQEAMIFASALAAMTASWSYSTIHSAAGREHADTWMHQIFLQIGAGVKGRGTPVVLQITLKSIPTGAAAKKSAIAQEGPAVELCKCVLDAGGHCRACEDGLVDGISRVVEYSVKVEGLQDTMRCTSCVNKLFDLSFAKVVREKFPGASATVRDMVTAMAIQMGAAHGVSSVPNVEKALGELSAKA